MPDVLSIRSGKGTRDFTVSYSSGGNVTAAVVAGTYETFTMESGSGLSLLKKTVTPNKKTLLKKGKVLRKTLAIQATATSKTLPSNTAASILRVMTRRVDFSCAIYDPHQTRFALDSRFAKAVAMFAGRKIVCPFVLALSSLSCIGVFPQRKSRLRGIHASAGIPRPCRLRRENPQVLATAKNSGW